MSTLEIVWNRVKAHPLSRVGPGLITGVADDDPSGIATVPLMAVIILLVCNKSVMGPFTASRPIVILGWIGTAVMGLAAVRMFIPG